MNWKVLDNEQQLATINEESRDHVVAIFKHSTRCSISVMVKNRLERVAPVEGVDFYYLDLLQYRPISNKIAADYAVHHESPQVLLIRNGACFYVESQNGISMEDIADAVTTAA